MTLLEMSVVYAEHAAVIRSRIVELRGLTRQETDPEAVQALSLIHISEPTRPY